jgi:glycosyltransferase involved in cell wall biosynthesis
LVEHGPLSVTVVVPSHGRHLRLRWLLNALEEQGYAGPWDVVVVHDYPADVARRVLDDHPLSRDGALRHVAIAPGSGSPPRQRNLGWRLATGRAIAFVDDDCRPAPDWLELLVASVRDPDRDVVQGTTVPDDYERGIFAAPHVRSLRVEPPTPFVQTCNVLYPRRLLERLGGFDERAIAGEDIELSQRAIAAGSAIVGAPRAVVHHAVESHTLAGIVRENLKWRHAPYVVKRHPGVRRELVLAVFWDRDHLLTAAMLAGLLGALRRRAALVLVVPYVLRSMGRRGRGLRRRMVAAAELPAQAIREAAEVAGMAVGSVRHGTFLL